MIGEYVDVIGEWVWVTFLSALCVQVHPPC